MAIMKTVIRLTRENHELCHGFVKIHTAFGEANVPNSDIDILSATVIRFPSNYLYKAGFNPCQILNGYLGEVSA